MKPFTHTSSAQRVVFGDGSLDRLAQEIELLGATRALVLSTPEHRADALRVAEMLGSRAAGVFDGAVMHVPIEVVREARSGGRGALVPIAPWRSGAARPPDWARRSRSTRTCPSLPCPPPTLAPR